MELGKRRGRHIITTAIEHAAVLEPCRELERQGYEVTYLRPDREGNISLEELGGRFAAGHGAGVHDTGEQRAGHGAAGGPGRPAGPAAGQLRPPSHCDGVQGFLKLPFTPAELGVDLLTVSGHKIHAPKGDRGPVCPPGG